METFVTFSMCLYIIAVVLQMVILGSGNFPITRRESRGEAVFKLGINLAVLLWVLSIKY